MNRISTKKRSFSQSGEARTNFAADKTLCSKKHSVGECGSIQGKISVFNQILDFQHSALSPHLKTVFLDKEKFIYRHGDLIDEVYFPENAVISEYQMLEDGRTSEVAMIGREGVTGLEVILDSVRARHWTRVSVAGSALKIESSIFKREFDNDPKFRAIVLNYISYYLKQTTQKIICNCYHLIEKRLCCWLLMLRDRSGKNDFTLTHEQLAHLLGVQRPSITRTTQLLRKKGVINYERGEIEIVDCKKLEDAACACYSLVGKF